MRNDRGSRNGRTADRGQRRFHSYDYILEKNIGRPSMKTLSRIHAAQKLGILLTGLVVTFFVLSLTIFLSKEPVEASDGIERRKDYILVEVKEGDSLWSLAEEYKSEESTSIESLIAEIEDINNIQKNIVLKPGNRLMIPCYKTVLK